MRWWCSHASRVLLFARPGLAVAPRECSFALTKGGVFLAKGKERKQAQEREFATRIRENGKGGEHGLVSNG